MIQILPMCSSPREQLQTELPHRVDLLCRVLFALAVFFALVSATGLVCGISMLVSDAIGGIV
jgi:hypothetical protein